MPFLRLSPRMTVVVAVVAIAIAVASFKTYDYVQHDPRFCTSCHIMDDAYALWSDSVHSGITCHDCHIPDLATNIKQLYVYWTDPPDAPRHQPQLENSICVRCHNIREAEEIGDSHWQAVMAQAGHREHVGTQKIQCIRCHSPSVHRFVPLESVCVECHKHTILKDTRMDQHCTTCHAFKAVGRDDLKPVRGDCIECHQWMQVGAEVFPGADENGLMHWDCRDCHKPHTKAKLGTEDCRACHEGQLAESPLHNVDAHANCTSCHRPHSWRIDPESSCLACHADRTEHADDIACNVCHQ